MRGFGLIVVLLVLLLSLSYSLQIWATEAVSGDLGTSSAGLAADSPLANAPHTIPAPSTDWVSSEQQEPPPVPVPEPGSMLLLAVSALAVFGLLSVRPRR